MRAGSKRKERDRSRIWIEGLSNREESWRGSVDMHHSEERGRYKKEGEKRKREKGEEKGEEGKGGEDEKRREGRNEGRWYNNIRQYKRSVMMQDP